MDAHFIHRGTSMTTGFFFGDGIDGLRSLPPNSIDQHLISPPYGDLRIYGGHPFGWREFTSLAEQLWRTTKTGGVLTWQESDRMVDGSLTLDPYYHLIHFKHLGFTPYELILSGTIDKRIRTRHLTNPPQPVFVLSKGRPTTVNYQTRINRTAGQSSGVGYRTADGRYVQKDRVIVKDESTRDCFWLYEYEDYVWLYPAGSHTEEPYRQAHHGALMHRELARDLIESYSRLDDLVCDALGGLCTTGQQATLLGRRHIGWEIHKPYHTLGAERLQQARRDRIAQLRQGTTIT
jgi:DNA modification methylase